MNNKITILTIKYYRQRYLTKKTKPINRQSQPESTGQNFPKSIQEIQMFGSVIRALPIADHKNLKRKWLSFVDRGFPTVDKI